MTIPGATRCTAGPCLKSWARAAWRKAGQDLPAPRALTAIVRSRLSALTEAAQRLVTAAAVLGRRCPLAAAAALAGLADPLSALDEAAAAGLLVEDRAALAADIAFAHRWFMLPSGTPSAPAGHAGCTGLRPCWSPALPPCPTG